jgi:phosphoribosylamine--glycine ligase
VIQPAVDTMRRRGTPYAGLLYAGLALTSAGLRVVEFNARFGDPETQVVLDRLASPLAPLLAAAAAGDLAGARLEWSPGAAVTVVIAAEGYPEAPVKGQKIKIAGAERAGLMPSGPGQPASADAAAGTGVAAGAAGTGSAGTGVAAGAYILHAGTALDADGDLVSAGGRVLNVVGSGPDVASARAAAYELAGTVSMPGGWYRRDIAARL